MKRMMAYMLAGVLTLGCGTTAFGAEKISGTMMVQDTEVTQPLYADEWGTKLVPVREVGDILGYTVAWDKQTRSVTLSDGTTTVGFASGKDAYLVEGETKSIGGAPELMDGVQYVPADLFSAFFPVAMQTKAGQLVFTDLTAEGVEQVTGTVVEAAQYNLVLRLEDGTLRIFTKNQADMTRAGSLEKDSAVAVYCKSADPKTALKIVAVLPETVNVPAVEAPVAETPVDTTVQEG